MQGQLFTQDFLGEGIKETEAWRLLDDAVVEEFRVHVSEIFEAFPVTGQPNEATTERNLIDPILRALGWEHFLVQQSAGRRRRDVPDYLLFHGAEAFQAANRERQDVRRYPHGTAIVEAKRWERFLDRGREPDLFDDGVPSTQMLRYLSRVEVASERHIQWGILTNGRHWRLYYQGARSRSEEFLELDLPIIAEIVDVERDMFSPYPENCQHLLKVFLLMLRRETFLATDPDGRTFHQLALDEGRLWEAGVAQSLSGTVFKNVFPTLIRALVAHDPQAPEPIDTTYLDEARVAALTLLYRILFLLYAEDRNLLPVRDDRYDDYALRRIRESVRDRIDTRDTFSATQGRYHQALKELFVAIHRGDEALGLPPYNGGLFDPDQHLILNRVTIPDAEFAPMLDALSRRTEGDSRKWINYRDLSVQQLGSIYERLLEYGATVESDGRITIRPNIFARRTSGSYYTHDDLVSLIIERAVGPLLEERRNAFLNEAEELRSARTRKATRLEKLRELDPATSFLRLRICDPAMGSGHFLVSLVDYLADAALEAIAEAEAAVDWASPDHPYRSPLVERIETIRQRILEQADEHRWTIDREQLDDRHIVRRMILKRSVYGADKNPMAVELAKVSLWLHTFTVGAPLSFLDHHLRCGDSLFGEWVGPAMQELSERYGLLINPAVQQARAAVEGMRRIEQLTDADIGEVRTSSEIFDHVTEDTEPLRRFLDFRHALRWLGYHNLNRRDLPREIVAIMDGTYGDPFAVVSAGIPAVGEESEEPKTEDLLGAVDPKQLPPSAAQVVGRKLREDARTLLDKARVLAERDRYLHWQIAFPGVWQDWESREPRGGFDVIIGNPPWDRMKLQEVEWFAARRPEVALAIRASDRKRMINALRDREDPLWHDYLTAKSQSENAVTVARNMRDYPLLSGGDVNIYSLFVERAHGLIRAVGLVGLLTPSGIASDKSASAFFRGISTTGRLAALFDFENKRVFFPDVHASFKFCTYVAGGTERIFDGAECAFYLHDVAELSDPDRRFVLRAEDFARVNPNTGTAPVFRTRRDAELTTAIYERVPVLVDRRGDSPNRAWPVRYLRMFDMTNDASLFRRAQELENDGFYQTGEGRWRRGEEECVPLYEGKMVQGFDHRAASVVVNPENLNRPAQPEPATPEQHQNPDWTPDPQYRVASHDLRALYGLQWYLAFKDVTAPTNVRTMIAALIPAVAVGNTLPLLLPVVPGEPAEDASEEDRDEYEVGLLEALQAYRSWAPLVLGNLNSFSYDYLARQKVHGQHLNFFIVEQLPLLPERPYDQTFGEMTASELVRYEVLRLTFTAHDMAPFARDMGYEGEPFPWDEEDRRHRRARLDALYFLLYGINREDAGYILDTFPIVRREDEAAFGRYVTRELILAYMNALEAGDRETIVSV